MFYNHLYFKPFRYFMAIILVFLASVSSTQANQQTSVKTLTLGDQFLLAVANNHQGQAQALLQQGVPINYRSSNRELISQVKVRADKLNVFLGKNQRYQYATGTAYDIALSHVQAPMVKWLLQRGANPAAGYFKQQIENTPFAQHYPASYLNLPYNERSLIVSVGAVLAIAVSENNVHQVAQLLAIEPRAVHYQGNKLLPNILRLGKWQLANVFLSRGKNLDQLKALEQTLDYPLSSEPTHYPILQGLLNHAKKRKDLNYQPLIIKAMKKHDGKALSMLVQAGASLSPKNQKPPLFIAAEQKDWASVALLLKLGADPNQTYRQETLLHQAIAGEQTELVRTLLVGGADVNINNRFKQTPIHIAIHKESPALTLLLLQYHADTSIKNGSSLLHTAINENKPALIAPLIRGGAPVNAQNIIKETPLFLAVKNSQLATVTQLLKAGANPNIQDRNNQSALQLALTKKQTSFAQQLLKAKADPNVTDNNGNTPLMIAVQQVRVPLIKLLLQARAKVNQEKRYGNKTALHEAIDKADLNIMRLLLQAKADVNIRTNYQQTALHLAVLKKHLGMINLILQHRSAINVLDSSGHSALHQAVIVKNLPIVQRLLQAKAQVNTTSNFGSTPLTDALSNRKPQIAQLLIQRGANINVITNSKQSPLDIARSRGLQGIARLMEQKGAKTAETMAKDKVHNVKLVP